jgi:hypothetical protein
MLFHVPVAARGFRHAFTQMKLAGMTMKYSGGILVVFLCLIGIIIGGCEDDSLVDGRGQSVRYSLVVACESQSGTVQYMLEMDIGNGLSLDSTAMPFSEPPFSFVFSNVGPNVYWSVPDAGIFSLLQTTWPVVDTIGFVDSTGGELTLSSDDRYLRIPGTLYRVPGLMDLYEDNQDRFNGAFLTDRNQYVYRTLESNTLYFIDYGTIPVTTVSDTLIGSPFASTWIQSVRPTVSGDSLIVSGRDFSNLTIVDYLLIVDTDNLTVLDTIFLPADIPGPDMVPLIHPDGRRIFWIEGFTAVPPDDIVFSYRLDAGQFEVLLDRADVGELIASRLLMAPGRPDLLVVATDEAAPGVVTKIVRIDLTDNSSKVLREFPSGISIRSASVRTVVEEN